MKHQNTIENANFLGRSGSLEQGLDTNNQTVLLEEFFSKESLIRAFKEKLSRSSVKGIDRINGPQFSRTAEEHLAIASRKCLAGTYNFTPFLETLKLKGRNKNPRIIGIPCMRDRVILHQLNKLLSHIYKDSIPKTVSSWHVRKLSDSLINADPEQTWVLCIDIKEFYDSIERDKLIKILSRKIKNKIIINIIEKAIATPIVPKNTIKKEQNKYATKKGIPQGISISNILASIYMEEIDKKLRDSQKNYYRYVDDIIMHGDKDTLNESHEILKNAFEDLGLEENPSKKHFKKLSEKFSYLGYEFSHPSITVKPSTAERFLQSIAAKFSEYSHNKERKLSKLKHLTLEKLKEVFISEINERITGAISEKRRYGWIAYFNQINDLKLLYHMDNAIESMFKRLPDFDKKPPSSLKKLRKAYFEIKHNPSGGYIHNYDKVATIEEKRSFLEKRGRIDPKDSLDDNEIENRYQNYRRSNLATMQRDEGNVYT